MNWYLKVLGQYSDFNGRARRKEYWMFTFLNMIFAFGSVLIDSMIGNPIFYIIYVLAMFIPGLAVSVRRLHDVGKSGWMILITLVPLIGAIWLIVLMVTDSNPAENQYGPNPKQILE